jgi:hypothetical protein
MPMVSMLMIEARTNGQLELMHISTDKLLDGFAQVYFVPLHYSPDATFR